MNKKENVTGKAEEEMDSMISDEIQKEALEGEYVFCAVTTFICCRSPIPLRLKSVGLLFVFNQLVW